MASGVAMFLAWLGLRGEASGDLLWPAVAAPCDPDGAHATGAGRNKNHTNRVHRYTELLSRTVLGAFLIVAIWLASAGLSLERLVDGNAGGEVLERGANRLEQRDLVGALRGPASRRAPVRAGRRRWLPASARRRPAAGRCRRPPWWRRRGCRHRRGRARIASSSLSRMAGVKPPTRSTWVPGFSSAPLTSGRRRRWSPTKRCRPGQARHRDRSRRVAARPSARSSAAAFSALAGVRFQIRMFLIGRTAECALARNGAQRAGADHQQARGVLAGQIGGGKRRGAGSAPLRQPLAVDQRLRLAGARRRAAGRAPSPPACRARCCRARR